MSGDPLANTAAGSAALGVGTFLLKDIRDDKTYLTRRLADGNCWMVQNLDLDLKSFAGKTEGTLLTPDNTNISASREDLLTSGTTQYWDPSAKMRAKSSVLENTGILSEPLSTANYQFQDYINYGIELKWGSVCEEGTGPLAATPSECISISAANNANNSWPRAYNNDMATAASTGEGNGPAYLTGTSSVKNSTSCEQDDTAGSHINHDCAMPGRIASSASMSAGSYVSYDNGTEKDTAWQPGLITSSDNDTFTMRGSMYFGDYYSFSAATAESLPYNASGIATQDICPMGWRLPKADNNGSWQNLLNAIYGFSSTDEYSQHNRALLNKIMQLPLSIPMTGRYEWTVGALTYRGDTGNYWTSRGITGGKGNFLDFFNDGWFRTLSNDARVRGMTIRCVSHGTENQVTPPEDVVQSTCAANSICYDSNGGTGTMNNTTGATFGSSKVLSAPTYTRTGYAFVGWSESKDAVQSGAYIYGPNETITVPNLSSEGMTLYAQWLAPENSSYTMQAFGRNETVKTCANMTDGNNGTTEERIALRDERDDNVYIVTKLKDGNCWMTSNLALNLADFAGKTTGTLLTPENTDLTASREDLSTLTIEGVGAGQSETITYYDPGMSMYKHAISLTCPNADTTVKDLATLQSSCPSVTPGVDGNYFSIASEDRLGVAQTHQFQSSGETGNIWGTYYSDVNGVKTKDTTTIKGNQYAEMPREYHRADIYGDYYNWYGAVAESGGYSWAYASGKTPDSICASGWKLPDSDNWGAMFTASGLVDKDAASVRLTKSIPYLILRSGRHYTNGSIGELTGSVRFWSSRANDSLNGQDTGLFNDRILSHDGGDKAGGNPIRCYMPASGE